MSKKPVSSPDSWLSKIILGFVVAATGVGAGDLITASLAGSQIGVVLVWAALGGALIKFVLAEGIARWQMATGTTVLEGWVLRLGRWIQWAFFVYFIFWSYCVGGALINACGVAGVGLFPIGDVQTSKIFWGIVHSVVGLALVWIGGFKIFQVARSLLTNQRAVIWITKAGRLARVMPGWASALAAQSDS